MKVGFIGGTGWIGLHVVKGMLDKQLLKPSQCMVSNRSADFSLLQEYAGIHTTTDNNAVFANSDVLFICVRPLDVGHLQWPENDKLMISVMAGVQTQTIEQRLGSKRIVRSMPNAAIEVYESTTPWFATDSVSAEQKAWVQKAFSAFGWACEIEQEDMLNYLTALTGSSHGTIAYFQNAMLQSALEFGIAEPLARRMVQHVFSGNSALMRDLDRNPKKDVQTVIDYDGTTAALCRKLNELNVEKAIKQAILASYEKASSHMDG